MEIDAFRAADPQRNEMLQRHQTRGRAQRAGKRLRLLSWRGPATRWSRGFVPAWAAFTVLWVLIVGRSEYSVWTERHEVIHIDRECWPRGQPFDEWVGFKEEPGPGKPPDVVEAANQKRDDILQQLRNCEEARPIWVRVARELMWPDVQRSLARVLLPPTALLTGWIIACWFVREVRNV